MVIDIRIALLRGKFLDQYVELDDCIFRMDGSGPIEMRAGKDGTQDNLDSVCSSFRCHPGDVVPYLLVGDIYPVVLRYIICTAKDNCLFGTLLRHAGVENGFQIGGCLAGETQTEKIILFEELRVPFGFLTQLAVIESPMKIAS